MTSIAVLHFDFFNFGRVAVLRTHTANVMCVIETLLQVSKNFEMDIFPKYRIFVLIGIRKLASMSYSNSGVRPFG